MENGSLRSLIEAIPHPIMVVGQHQYVIAANRQTRALLGDHIVGSHFVSVLRQPVLVSAVEQVLQGGAAMQARYHTHDGDLDIRYDVAVEPHEKDVVLTFEDLTAAHSVNQFRRDFVANVSHELRTPLTALFGFIETLRGPAKDDAAARARFLEIMEREASRMIRLVDDLLSLSRVEEEERVRPVEQVVLADIIRATLSELAPVIRKAGAEVLVQDDSGNQVIPAEPRQIRQVVVNLVENAIKYGAPKGQVTIHLAAPAYAPKLRTQALVMTVTDRGPGIASHHIPRLTERFYRVDGHRSREVGGTGLGLAIVKHIINRHRGRLQISSTLGEGTSISVTLPI